jgi:hypothetical protein
VIHVISRIQKKKKKKKKKKKIFFVLLTLLMMMPAPHVAQWQSSTLEDGTRLYAFAYSNGYRRNLCETLVSSARASMPLNVLGWHNRHKQYEHRDKIEALLEPLVDISNDRHIGKAVSQDQEEEDDDGLTDAMMRRSALNAAPSHMIMATRRQIARSRDSRGCSKLDDSIVNDGARARATVQRNMHNVDSDDDVVMLIDAHDMLFARHASPAKFVRRLRESGAAVLFGAELNCWPAEPHCALYPDAFDYESDPSTDASATCYRFLNAGAFIGYASAVRAIVEYVRDDATGDQDDQRILSRGFAHGTLPVAVALDRRVRFVYNLDRSLGLGALSEQLDDVLWDDRGRAINRVTKSRALLYHFNGNGKRRQRAFNRIVVGGADSIAWQSHVSGAGNETLHSVCCSPDRLHPDHSRRPSALCISSSRVQ